ncbi:unnamed protein product [Rodentolepis nana]|uniref:Transmembrane protein 163 n=1 Tax=Rodentolepis nana TaxID=102285 RepID=A0A0R3TPG9_RODNA|nr:unnamed protein product [Rodentolepis nana]
MGVDGWGCGGSILSDACIYLRSNEATGALLLTATLFVVLSACFMILLLIMDEIWAYLASCISAGLSVIFGLAGILHHIDTQEWWSPFLATVAFSFTVILTIHLCADIIAHRHQIRRAFV